MLLSSPKAERWYRYDDVVYAGCYLTEWGGEEYYTTGPRLRLLEYEVLRHTPKGVWLRDGCDERWVGRAAKRRLAYPTKEEALQSFAARKRRQIEILKGQLNRAERALQLAEEKGENEPS